MGLGGGLGSLLR